jgi:hypothetical protein
VSKIFPLEGLWIILALILSILVKSAFAFASKFEVTFALLFFKISTLLGLKFAIDEENILILLSWF